MEYAHCACAKTRLFITRARRHTTPPVSVLGLLNSPQSVTHSGACDELNLLINARMGVGHAGVAIKRSSCRQRHGVAVFSARDSFSQKYVLTAKRCWWRPGALLNFLYSDREQRR